MGRLGLLWILMLLYALPMLGQGFGTAYYTHTQGYGVIDNVGNCGTNNCLLRTVGTANGNVVLGQISSAFDGYVLGLDASGAFWKLPIWTPSAKPIWSSVSAMGSGAKYVAVRTQTEIYALFPGTGCTSPSYVIRQWNGSSWRTLNGCLSELSITQEDTLVGVNAAGQAWFTTNPNASTVAWAQITGTWTHMVGFTANMAFGTSGNVLYQVAPLANTFGVMSGAPLVSTSVSTMAVTEDGYLFILESGSGQNIFYYNFMSSTPAWVNIAGSGMNHIAGNARDAIFLLDGNGYPYHALMTAIVHSTTVSGYYSCSATSGCPSGAVHTAHAPGRFPHGYNTASEATSSGAPATPLDAYYVDTSGTCDFFYGDPTAPDCIVGPYTASVDCSRMGNVFSSGGEE